jgi:hypothetical protein
MCVQLIGASLRTLVPSRVGFSAATGREYPVGKKSKDEILDGVHERNKKKSKAKKKKKDRRR